MRFCDNTHNPHRWRKTISNFQRSYRGKTSREGFLPNIEKLILNLRSVKAMQDFDIPTDAGIITEFLFRKFFRSLELFKFPSFVKHFKTKIKNIWKNYFCPVSYYLTFLSVTMVRRSIRIMFQEVLIGMHNF